MSAADSFDQLVEGAFIDVTLTDGRTFECVKVSNVRSNGDVWLVSQIGEEEHYTVRAGMLFDETSRVIEGSGDGPSYELGTVQHVRVLDEDEIVAAFDGDSA